MTDGRQTRDPEAVELDVAAEPIHKEGARVLVVGIGPKISENELRRIAKDPSYVFKVESFENLRKATRDVAASACINPCKIVFCVKFFFSFLSFFSFLLFHFNFTLVYFSSFIFCFCNLRIYIYEIYKLCQLQK